MAGKNLDVVHDKRQMREIRSHLDRSASVVFADLDELLALRCLEKNQLRAASAGIAPDLFQPEHLLVEVNGLFQVGDAVIGAFAVGALHGERLAALHFTQEGEVRVAVSADHAVAGGAGWRPWCG